MGAKLGYARVSTGDQDVAGQTMRLTDAGALKVFSDTRSGRTMERPGLGALLAYARDGDTLAVVRLDRLGRSLGELLATVAMLNERGIALLSLEERLIHGMEMLVDLKLQGKLWILILNAGGQGCPWRRHNR
jgi:DNA invertase Pin-like site-specific DNA recombinase